MRYNKTEYDKKIKKIFCRVLEVEESDVNDDTAYDSLEVWDSLKHLEFVGKVEDEFSIDIEMDDVIAMENFRLIKKIVYKYIS